MNKKIQLVTMPRYDFYIITILSPSDVEGRDPYGISGSNEAVVAGVQ